MNGSLQRFDQVDFDAGRGTLSVAGRRVGLDRSCMALLSLLMREAGEDVAKDRLLEAGWPGRVVHENSLAKAVSRLRQALGEDGRAIETVHGYGYRLAADVESVVGAARPPRLAPRAHWFRRPFVVLTAVALAGLAALGLAVLSGGAQRDEARRVVNAEPMPMIGRVLWVDDHPENNLAEKRFLEQRKIAVYQVGTTEDALTLLAMYRYGAVISDMGRDGKPLAGLTLLEAMREQSNVTPFVLYTIRSSEAQRRIVADAGGQHVAETRDQLFASILPLFDAAAE